MPSPIRMEENIRGSHQHPAPCSNMSGIRDNGGGVYTIYSQINTKLIRDNGGCINIITHELGDTLAKSISISNPMGYLFTMSPLIVVSILSKINNHRYHLDWYLHYHIKSLKCPTILPISRINSANSIFYILGIKNKHVARISCRCWYH